MLSHHGISECLRPLSRARTMGAAKIVGQSATGGAMALTFEPARTQYDADRDIVRFMGMDGVLMVRCAVSREALMDKARSTLATDEDLVDIYIFHADVIQQIAVRKYAAQQTEPDGLILVKTADLNR